ncbi:MAG TPA: hypothetical protein PK854_00635 [Oscillospiraceae bacterium]|nr:hypothetical protein [Oscillospiraceae bacterium]HPS33759.1 hypothetical protein [Oscillospiraceae bacterium]
MFKKIRKYLIVLMAVLMVASLAVIPMSAVCSIDGDYDQDEYQQPDGFWVYAANGWAYYSDSPFSCCLTTTAGTSWGYGEPGGTLARAQVYVSGLTYQDALAHDVTNFTYSCFCH